MLEFENGVTGVICTARPTPYFWRVHVFGTKGSAEAVGETELVVRMSGEKPRRFDFEPVDQVRVELEMVFALRGVRRLDEAEKQKAGRKCADAPELSTPVADIHLGHGSGFERDNTRLAQLPSG